MIVVPDVNFGVVEVVNLVLVDAALIKVVNIVEFLMEIIEPHGKPY